MDPNQPNAMSLSQAMHDVPIEAHMMSDHLNHQHHSMGHPQLSHSTPIDPSMEIASKSLPHAKSQLNSPLQGDQMNHLQQKMDSDSALTHQLEQSEIIETVQFDTPQSPDMALGEPKEGNFSEPNPDLTCDICHKTYENKRFLNYHYTSTHKEQKKNLKCAFAVLADCSEKFRTRKDYEDHLQTEHKCGLSQETLQFNDITEFELWKHKMEETTNSHFVLNRGGNKYKNGQTVRGYKCSRSGDKPRAATGKKSKKQQPEKNRPMGAECPAYIRAVIGENKVDVTFISTHIGHTVEPFSQSLHREAKKRIVMKRMKLEERHQAYNSRRIRQERLVIQRSDIINDLNSLDLSLGGLKGERVEKVLQMLRLTLDMYKDAEGAVSNVELQENGNQLHSVSNEGSNLFVTDDMIIF